MYKKVVLAYDGSSFSMAALHQGAEIAKHCEAELHLLSIAETTGSMAIAEAVGTEDVWGAARQRLEKTIELAVADLRGLGVTVVVCVREGDPASEIAAYAHEIGANLVVLGHTEKGALNRWFGNSISSRLLDHLPCSLLVAIESPSPTRNN